jgi:MFS family permease
MLIRRPAPGAALPPAAAPETAGRGAVGRSAAIGLRELLRSRAFQVILLIVLVSNATWGGVGEVALPTLAHQHYGVGGYGALLAAISGGVIAGTFAAAAVKPGRPMLLALLVFFGDAGTCAALPYLGGLTGAAAALVLGACNGFGNVLALTVIQRWAPPQLLGKAMSLIMLAAPGVFPLSAALTGFLVRHIGPAVFFPLAGLTLAGTLAIGLASRQVRELGSGA